MTWIIPFSLSFGKEPLKYISREPEREQIISDFSSEYPTSNIYMLTGVRGSGKTVLLSSVANEMRKNSNWIVIDLNSERNMFYDLLAELKSSTELLPGLSGARFDVSFMGVGLNPESSGDPITAIDKILRELTEKGKRVLITLDEAVSGRRTREFSAQFQIFLRKGYQVFMLMAGLYDNISKLQDGKALTFLYRAPRIEVGPLSLREIARSYADTFSIDTTEATSMAEATKGYAYAYQILGYLCCRHECGYREVMDEYDTYLFERVYDKLWAEMSDNDRKASAALASGFTAVEDIRKHAGMSSNTFSVYRSRLLKKGICHSPQYGHLAFTLPRFEEYVKYVTGGLSLTD